MTPMGVLLPESILRNEFFAVLAAFVAINTIVYVTLAVAEDAAQGLLSRDWIGTRNRRRETRSIRPGRAGLRRAGRRDLRLSLVDRSNMYAAGLTLASAQPSPQRCRTGSESALHDTTVDALDGRRRLPQRGDHRECARGKPQA